MRKINASRELLATLARGGRVTVGRAANIATVGFVMRAAGAVAQSGLKKASDSPSLGRELRFPNCCCNCLGESGVRPVESSSIVNHGVAYTFRLPIPHCRDCAETANRKRPGLMGQAAAFIAISVSIGIVMLGVGVGLDRDDVIFGGLILAPVAGVLFPYLWARARRSRRRPSPVGTRPFSHVVSRSTSRASRRASRGLRERHVCSAPPGLEQGRGSRRGSPMKADRRRPVLRACWTFPRSWGWPARGMSPPLRGASRPLLRQAWGGAQANTARGKERPVSQHSPPAAPAPRFRPSALARAAVTVEKASHGCCPAASHGSACPVPWLALWLTRVGKACPL